MDCVATVVEGVVVLVKSRVSLEGLYNGKNVSGRPFVVLGDKGYKSRRTV